jgi:pimeloyl-ACP methyl ester carboxylesterase
MKTEPFKIDIPATVIADLRDRLTRTRFADEPPQAGWSMGTERGYLQRLVQHWRQDYDWYQQQTALNALPQFTATVKGTRLHFVHARAAGKQKAPALLLLHGWPDSFYRYHKVVPLLAGAGHFEVVVPSLPGFAFSDHTAMTVDATADLMVELMRGLGHDRFVVAGGDLGSMVAMAVARRHPGALHGLHLTDVGYPDGNTDFASLTPPEMQFAQTIQGWWMQEGAFNLVQSTKPQSLAFALNDSPAGLAAWLVSMIASGNPERLEERFTFDELLTNLTLYWVTGTIASSMRGYAENARAMYANPPPQKPGRIDTVPTAVAHMPWDAPLPRAWAERWVNVVQFTEMPRGGHFTAWEAPDAYVEDLRAFRGTLGL